MLRICLGKKVLVFKAGVVCVVFSRHHVHITNISYVYMMERWGAGVEYDFQEFNEPYAPS